jgi:hypothetical protein
MSPRVARLPTVSLLALSQVPEPNDRPPQVVAPSPQPSIPPVTGKFEPMRQTSQFRVCYPDAPQYPAAGTRREERTGHLMYQGCHQTFTPMTLDYSVNDLQRSAKRSRAIGELTSSLAFFMVR